MSSLKLTCRHAQEQGAIEAAALILAAGGLVAFPTETVYGLGARADDDAAVAGIFGLKGRPSNHPLIVHVHDATQARVFAADNIPVVAERLMQGLWPGALTVIVPRREGRATAAAGGQASIGLRCPSNPVALALLARAAQEGVPGLAAPSANRFGQVSPTLAQHVMDEFSTLGRDHEGAGVDQGPDALLVLDGGPCRLGIESTIIDCTRGHPVLLRPGTLNVAQIEAVAGMALRSADDHAPRASGTLASHYAPRATLRLMTSAQLAAALQLVGEDLAKQSPARVAIYSRTSKVPRGIPVRRMPDTAAAVAFELFAVLRELDASGVALIWVEEPPDAPEWDGVRDRLNRAATPS